MRSKRSTLAILLAVVLTSLLLVSCGDGADEYEKEKAENQEKLEELMEATNEKMARETAEAMLKAVYAGDADAFLKLIPEETRDAFPKSEIEAMLGESAEMLGEYDISVTATGTKDCSSSELKRIREFYENYEITVDAAKEVSLTITVKYGEEKEDAEDEIVVIRIGNAWYADMISTVY